MFSWVTKTFKFFSLSERWLLVLAAIFLWAQGFFIKPVMPPPMTYVAPPHELKYFTGGFQEQLGDSFWLRAIQDTHYCEKTVKNKECLGQSWFFKIIDLTVELAQNFSEAYYYGGLSLTVFIRDYKGASVIFDKATARFKYEWPMLYLAAYHALFEEKNKVKAAQLYLRAADNGAPAWVRLSAGKLATDGGDVDFSEKVLKQLIELESDPKWVESLKEKLAEVQAKPQDK